tara:strand:- start:333 stop:707 length:375 start_codon:yes stop_codon:yes gene_type:complete
MTKNKTEEDYLIDGIDLFNSKKFYAAHDCWEYLWTEYPLKDSLFIQGLIQLSVAYFHITNLNLTGSKNLFNKSLPKLKKFPSSHRNINVEEIIILAEKSLNKVIDIDKVNQFDWSLVPQIKLKK